MRRPEQAQSGVSFVGDLFEQGLRETRLADTRLTRHQHHAPLATLGLLPPALQQRQLLVAANSGVAAVRNAAKRPSTALSRARPLPTAGPKVRILFPPAASRANFQPRRRKLSGLAEVTPNGGSREVKNVILRHPPSGRHERSSAS